MRKKIKTIVFRLDKPLYDFIINSSVACRREPSEFIRDVLTYFRYGLMTGIFDQSLEELTEKARKILMRNNPNE